MRRIGILALILGVAALLVIAGLTAAGRDASTVVNSLLACFWGALAGGLMVRLIRAGLRGQSIRRELRPVADAAAVYSELLTSTPPAAAEARRLPAPIGDDRESSETTLDGLPPGRKSGESIGGLSQAACSERGDR